MGDGPRGVDAIGFIGRSVRVWTSSLQCIDVRSKKVHDNGGMDSSASFVPVNTADNWLHFVLGMIALGVL